MKSNEIWRKRTHFRLPSAGQPRTLPGMIIRLYWITRILGYAASLVGVFLYLHHQADAAGDGRNLSFAIIGAGFVSFFISYAIRAWLRFGARAQREIPGP